MIDSKGKGKLRSGFTTGSCAAAAAGAACRMLFTGKIIRQITIITPKGIPFPAQIVDIDRHENVITCGVVKDGGDDPDVTNGLHILATVSYLHSPALNLSASATQKTLLHNISRTSESSYLSNINNISEGGNLSIFSSDDSQTAEPVLIEGGDGVGRVTKPGLDQPVGAAAINHVPREMIREQVELAKKLCDVHQGIRVIISVPGGEEAAEKTFNPRLGIKGGISILGTCGIVEPMSEQALKDTIRVELSQKRALGYTIAAVSPGNYGLDFMKQTYGYDLDKSVKCSNYIGDTIDMAADLDFSDMLLTGHIGKLVKVSGGIMNTHSREGDCRMELMAAAALRCGADANTARAILSSVSTVEGVRILRDAGGTLLANTMNEIMSRIMFYLEKRAAGRIHIECMMYTNEDGLLAESEGAGQLLSQLLRE